MNIEKMGQKSQRGDNVPVWQQNLPKVFFGGRSKAKLAVYLGNETFGRFL
jgi:hypothetical protein